MDQVGKQRGVIPRDAVRRITQPVMVDCASAGHGVGPIVVVPLLDGDRIAGLEIRCGCGASAVVECVYPTKEKP
jgi:hypothetical protein